MSICIRKAELNDYEEMERIALEDIERHYEALPNIFKLPKTCMDRACFEDLIHGGYPNFILLVASEENTLLGFLLGEIQELQETEDFKGRKLFYVRTIAVSASRKRQGVGSQLFQYIKNFSKEYNLSSIELDVFSFNTEAISFYEKIGMRILRQRMTLEPTYRS